ncbi:MAG: endonuclease III domain-containing protein [Candidatus Micrarchaeia archaeon]
MPVQRFTKLKDNEALEVIERLEKIYGDASYFLKFDTKVNLLVGAIIEARTKDEVVKEITSELFKRFHSAADYSRMSEQELLGYIKKSTFASNKAKNIINACKIIERDYGGNVPQSMEELVKLPGVGRKTANTILINGFNIVEGMPIDTWAIRVSYRLGLTSNEDPDDVEEDLKRIVPKKYWRNFAYVLKAHGKAVCNVTPKCEVCPINDICPKNQHG